MTDNEQECLEAYNSFIREKEVGDVVFITPKPPNPEDIQNWGRPLKERKFPYYPETITLANGASVRYENSLAEDEYEQLVYTEQERLDNGFFFYNGNKLEYVTGYHYIGLQWFIVPDAETGDSKKPDFIDAQRDGFYHFQWCDENPTLGAIWGTCRRWGKSLVAIIIGYIKAIRNFNAKVAIQSKTDADAEVLFGKLAEYWQKMPQFLKPTDTGDSRVKNQLVFAEPKKRSTKNQVKEYGVQLNSRIFSVAAYETALDGQRLTFLIQDEEGKDERNDVNERWGINSKCLMARKNIVGKSLHISTVEDMVKRGGENFKKIWDKSDVKTMDDVTNRTASGLRRFFIPADYGFEVDEFGYSNRESARKYHEAVMSKLTGGDLISYKRQYPLDESDMWLMEDGGCKFSLPRLYQQRAYNDEVEVHKNIRVGNLFWKNGRRYSGVVFDDDPNGRFAISYMPRPEHQCQFTTVNEQKRPRYSYFRIGIDPTDARSPVSGRGSRNAAYVLAMPSSLGFSRITPVCEYLYRHESPNDFYEDMLLLSSFYSAPVLPEANKSGIINYFEDKGALHLIMNDPTEKDPVKRAKKFGMHSTGDDLRNTLIGRAQTYVVENVGYLSGLNTHGDFPFDELLLDMIDFSPTAADARWTKWDCVVAFMFALAACDAEYNIIDDQQYQFNMGDFLNTYKIR